MSERIPALDELRENLREAARRDVAASAGARKRRRRRRTAGIVALALLGAGGAATAADLISVGEPVPEQRPGFQALRGRGTLSVKAADPRGGLAWGVGIYTSKSGQRCAIAGQVRGVGLGELQNGRFRPYGSDVIGSCRAGSRGFSDFLRRDGRTVAYGRAAPGVTSVAASLDGKPVTPARTGAGGAFLFVFEGTVTPDRLIVRLTR